MKELSIEQKAKRYDQAIERAKEMIKAMTNIGGVAKVGDIQYLFPELAESEGEIIRKALLTKFTNEKKQGGKYEIHGVSIDNIIAWLEKQGQVKDSAISQHENKTCKENDESLTSEDEKIRKWIIAYLENRAMNTSITDEKDNCLDAIRWLKNQGEQKPAEWSKEDKKVINLLLELVYEQDKMSPRIPSNEKRKMMLSWLKSLKPQPKYAEWSEENEVKINRIVACLENLNVADNDILLKDVNWLKSIKDIFVPQPKQEWSEEDEHRVKDTIYFLDTAKKHYASTVEIDACVEWLKSLRPQNHWKPSNEQMEALLYEVNAWDEDSANGQNLKSLYQDLKKLKE